MPDALNNIEEPQERAPSKCLNGAELWRKMSQRGLLIASYKRLKKDCDRAIPPAAEAVYVTVHLVPPGFPQAKQLHHLSTLLNTHWGTAATGKKDVLCLCVQGCFSRAQLFATL